MNKTMNVDSQQATFREVQKLDQWWILAIIYGLALMMWVMFVVQTIFGRPVGNNPAPDWMMWLLWIFVGIGLPIAWRRIHLLVEVQEEGIYIRFIPFARRDIRAQTMLRTPELAIYASREQEHVAPPGQLTREPQLEHDLRRVDAHATASAGSHHP